MRQKDVERFPVIIKVILGNFRSFQVIRSHIGSFLAMSGHGRLHSVILGHGGSLREVVNISLISGQIVLMLTPTSHFTWGHERSHRVTKRHVRSRRVTTRYVRSRRVTTRHVRSHRITTKHVRSRRVTVRHIMLSRVTTRHVRSRRVTRRHVRSRRMILPHVGTRQVSSSGHVRSQGLPLGHR